MRKFVINGKFMSQTVTGVQRYAREILLELDKIITKDYSIELVVDANAKNIPSYKNIVIKRIGNFTGNLWEQISLPLYVIKNHAVCISLCNMMPILTPHCVVIHDISFKVNPQFYSKKFSMWYKFVFRMCIRRIKRIITDTEFSKSEIKRHYGIVDADISVVSCGWQHFQQISFVENALIKYGLKKGEYYFAMSSMTPNKNFRWIAKAAQNNPDVVFAVSGSINQKVFGESFDFEVPENLKFLGYVSDEEAKSLMRDSKAFLFPTFYEGFGIPPLEALSVGAKAAVSDASCMREVFGNSVYYIDPNNAEVDLNALFGEDIESSAIVLEKFSWDKSAKLLKDLIISMR